MGSWLWVINSVSDGDCRATPDALPMRLICLGSCLALIVLHSAFSQIQNRWLLQPAFFFLSCDAIAIRSKMFHVCSVGTVESDWRFWRLWRQFSTNSVSIREANPFMVFFININWIDFSQGSRWLVENRRPSYLLARCAPIYRGNGSTEYWNLA